MILIHKSYKPGNEGKDFYWRISEKYQDQEVEEELEVGDCVLL